MHFLSYPLAEENPGYGSKSRVMIKKVKSIQFGDSCESFELSLSNHTGTHVDCPAHFFRKGLKVADINASSWNFNSPQVIKVRLRSGELLGVEALERKIKPKTDLLLIQSGWAKIRDQKEYSEANPGIQASVGRFLRSKYPNIRGIGFDWISLSSYLNRPEGRLAHQAFLDPKGKGQPILIIEDMDLRKATPRLKQVLVLPLRVEGIDSAPCTVLGKFL